MLNSQQKKIIQQNLSECDNVEEMFKLLSNTFDLKECRPGSIARPMFIQGILKGIDLINPKFKEYGRNH